MKLKCCLIYIACLLFCTSIYAQSKQGDDLNLPVNTPLLRTTFFIDSLVQTLPSVFWDGHNRFGIDLNEVTYQNWSAGGSNSVSLLLSANIERTLLGRNIRWKNEFIGHYGINAQEGRKIRKTEDQLHLNSTFGYRPDSTSGWFYSAKLNIKTQFAAGFAYPNRDLSVSGFMAPGYLFIGVGAEYGRDSKTFTLYISPATEKTTFVLNQRLADKGAFGVPKAVYDDNGNMVKRGEMIKSEFGILITNEYHTEVFDNIHFSNRISLYTDYINNFGNIDIDWRVNLQFRINKYVAAKIGSHLIYDDDIKTIKTNSAGQEVRSGPKVQWKQQLGIGLVVNI